MSVPGPAVHESIRAANAAVRMGLPFGNAEDFDDARHGHVASLSEPLIRATDGRIVWDTEWWSFVDAECPESRPSRTASCSTRSRSRSTARAPLRKSMTIAWQFTDPGRDYSLILANGVLRHRTGAPQGPTSATVRVSRTAFNHLIVGVAQPQDLLASGELVVEGDSASFGELLGLLDPPDPNFAIVTP